MVIYVDIDNTICINSVELNYEQSIPITDNINKINELYDKGHTIIYWTARGTATGIDWSDITFKQLNHWNVKYHKVLFNKPNYDVFIDDKNLNTSDLDQFFAQVIDNEK